MIDIIESKQRKDGRRQCRAWDVSTDSIPGTSVLPIYSMIVKLVVLANSLSFFGNELGKQAYHVTSAPLILFIAHNEKFMASALSYVEETFIIAEIVRLLPDWLQP